MSFTLLILMEDSDQSESMMEAWPAVLRERIPDITVHLCRTQAQAFAVIGECDAAFGCLRPEVFARARKLRWIASPLAGPPKWFYHEALVQSDVVVTNVRAIYNDHIGSFIVMQVLALAKGLHHYFRLQAERRWVKGYDGVYLPEATAVIVGVGGIGAETARLCAEFGMTVLGVDPRVEEAPPGMAEIHRPEALEEVLGRGDFVIVTVPETPQTLGLFRRDLFRRMKPTGFFINIGRGGTVVLDDLVAALEAGEIRGAALDVFETEPLPADHPLWGMPNVIVTPHEAFRGPYLDDRREEIFLDNCLRFSEGRPLCNVVDKANWF